MRICDLVKQHMEGLRYTALCGDECGCTADDLMPCGGEGAMDCRFGYANDCKTCAKRDECLDKASCEYGHLCRSVNCWEGEKGEAKE